MHGMLSCVPTLKPESQEIHSDKPSFFINHTRINRFITNNHPTVIGSHFRSPDPERFAQNHPMPGSRLIYSNIGCFQFLLCILCLGRYTDNQLRLTGFPVTVFSKINNIIFYQNMGITH